MAAVMYPLAASLLAFAAVLVISIPAVQYQRQAGVRRSLALVADTGAVRHSVGSTDDNPTDSPIGSAVRSFSGALVGSRQRARLRRHLTWAGKPTAEALRTAVDRKLIYATVALCLGLLVGLAVDGWLWLLAPVTALIGFFVPDVLIYNQALERTEQTSQGLPDALDMLNLCVESGLSLQAALARVAEVQQGPVAEEFGRVLQEMQLGVPRADAFEALATRTRQPDLQRFVGAMLQVDKVGIPVGAVLKEQSLSMRDKRHARAREQAQKVPVKILAPLLLCYLPCLFIIILGPAVITASKIFLGW